MSSEIAIKVENLSKCYQIYDQPRDRLRQMTIPRLQRLVGRQPKQYYREFWALKDISFDINKGETVGIIGRNGSGKSTLLQLICGTLNPTSGNIQTRGRIAALLELGSGFNPEFTGRENVYLYASVLGLSDNEIGMRFNQIASFADIGEFIEQPIKTYSSGMVVRLAFAVAINVDPEILIIDEALSVGDELFQRKCFSRIEAIRAAGATILFVSHSGGTILELCDRAILMESGEKLAVGPPKKIVGRYQKLLYAPEDMQEIIREQIRRDDQQIVVLQNSIKNTRQVHSQENAIIRESEEYFDPNLKPSSTIEYESRGAHISVPKVLTMAGEQVNNLIRGETYCYTYTVRFTKSACNVTFGMMIKTISGFQLGGTLIKNFSDIDLSYVEAGSNFRIAFHFRCILNAGVYFMNAGVASSEGFLHRLIDAAMFRVIPDSNHSVVEYVDFNEKFELERGYLEYEKDASHGEFR